MKLLVFKYLSSSSFFLVELTSQWSSSAWGNNGSIDAALGQHVVHVSEPPQTLSSALSFTAAGPDSTVVFVRLPPATSISAAANQFMLGTGTAIVGQTTDLTRLATVFILTVLPIVEWLSSVGVLSDVISTWASLGTVGVGSVVDTCLVVVKVDSFDSVLAVRAWTVVSNGFDGEPQVVVAFFSGPTE